MKKTVKGIVSVILVLTLVLSCVTVMAAQPTALSSPDTEVAASLAESRYYSYVTNNNIDPEELSSAVVIPGVFQSETHLYDKDGNLAKNADGEVYSAPFFLESTGDIVKVALKKALVPLLITLLTQHDWGGKLADTVAEVLGWVLGEKARTDEDGKFIYDVRADKYPGPVSECTPEQKEYIYDQIPLSDYTDLVDEDHLYFFSYCSFGNIDALVDELYELIVKAATNSPTGKTNIVPISQGGSLANNLLERYPEVGQYLDRIVYIVPALDGTVLLGELFEKGLIDDDNSLYNEIFPVLIDDEDTPYLGYVVNLALRLLPNECVNDIIDKAVDVLIGKYIKNCTTMWALVSSANYPEAAKKYLSDPADAKIRRQTDNFYQAQLNSDRNIMHQIEEYGVEVFDIVDYNYSLYPICDSWKQLNADGIIQLDSTSMGATSVGVDKKLPDNYVPAKGEKYIDSYRLVDAGTGLLPDSTFYFHNQNHESTARNDVIMKLAICLLTDKEFTSIDSYPDKYPQFNNTRDCKKFDAYLERMEKVDTSGFSAADKAEYEAALADLADKYYNTVVDTDAFLAARKRIDTVYNRATGNEPPEPTAGDKLSASFRDGFTDTTRNLSNVLFEKFGGDSFFACLLHFWKLFVTK